MPIVIKELIIKGKVVKDLPDIKLGDRLFEDYLRKIKREIIESCKDEVREEFKRELMK